MKWNIKKALNSISGNLYIPISKGMNRKIHFLIACLLISILIICAKLDPAHEGVGTHTKLGRPTCLICKLFGINRCPSCGLTTALCHFMHGNFKSAITCHKAVLPTFIVLACLAVFCIIVSVTGKNLIHYEVLFLTILGIFVMGLWLVALSDCFT